MSHAVLSPSAASRWLNCTPSARLEQQFTDTTGEAAKEGTVAHALGELLLRYAIGDIKKAEYTKALDTIKEDKYYNDAMQEHCEQYTAHVLECFTAAKTHTSDALLFLEQKLDLTEYVPEGFGTGDAIIIADRVLEIKDLKYGKGVPVFAENNKQMMLYALGALHAFDYIYAIDNVRMTIYQPRLDNISTWEISATDLKAWAETELRPKAAQAFEGIGDFVPGDHCRFCKVRAVCRANAEKNLELAKYEFRDSDLLEDNEIVEILNRADQFEKWLSSVLEYALKEAVNNGKKWDGYKLIEGKSNRKYTDDKAVVSTLIEKGYEVEKLYKPQEVIGITDMEKLLGKVKFKKYLNSLVVKPAGKLALVPVSHKTPEYNSVQSAVADFEEH